MVKTHGNSDFRWEVSLKEIVILLSCVYIAEEREREDLQRMACSSQNNKSFSAFYYIFFILMLSIANMKYLCA